jgi:phytanoyl-CoA hydroxylase
MSVSAQERLKADFARDGVVVVRNFLPTDELAVLIGHLERFIRDVVPGLRDGSVILAERGRPETLRVLENLVVDPVFVAYGRAARWMALGEVLLGHPVAPAIADEYSAFGWQAYFNIPPGTTACTPPHQDNHYYKFEPAETLSIWVALDPVDEDNGGMRYVRASHRKTFRDHGPGRIAGFSQVVTDFGPSDEANEISFRLGPGDAVVHHGKTIHRSPGSRVFRQRRGYSMFLRSAHCRRNEVAYAAYLESLKRHNEEFHLIEGLTPTQPSTLMRVPPTGHTARRSGDFPRGDQGNAEGGH